MLLKEKGQRSAGTKETMCYDSDSELPHEWAVVRNLSEPPTEVRRLRGGGGGCWFMLIRFRKIVPLQS